MKKILVVGGSGFIGTNLVEFYAASGDHEVLNLDVNAPRNPAHAAFWKKTDILNEAELTEQVLQFSPDYVLHMAARTDLDEKNSLSGYDANIKGITNMINTLKKCPSVKRVVFASSMLVCRAGYIPANDEDYCPPNLYGESKVLTEKLIRAANIDSFEWCIIRPTSIWGPWFGAPYRNFFDMVYNGRYFKIGSKVAVKTFGFIGNAVHQISELLLADSSKVNKKTFYIGDHQPTEINEWADEIAQALNIRLKTFPLPVFQLAAFAGDVLTLLRIPFPMSSFRLNNMRTNNIMSLEDTIKVVPRQPYTRQEGIRITLDWMKKHQ